MAGPAALDVYVDELGLQREGVQLSISMRAFMTPLKHIFGCTLRFPMRKCITQNRSRTRQIDTQSAARRAM